MCCSRWDTTTKFEFNTICWPLYVDNFLLIGFMIYVNVFVQQSEKSFVDLVHYKKLMIKFN